MVRRSDFRINAIHIAKPTGRSGRTVEDLRKRLFSENHKTLRGSKKPQGTYIDLDIGIDSVKHMDYLSWRGDSIA